MSALKEFFTHLRQRKLTRTLLAYGAVGWAILEGIDRYGGFLPDAVQNVAPLLFIAGIPYCLILGWYHGEKGRQTVGPAEATLLGLATVTTVGLFWLAPPREEPPGEGADLYRIGVLPFSAIGGSEEDLAGFADGLRGELSRTLAAVELLEVAPDRAVEPYGRGEVSLDSIAQAVGVSLLVEGAAARVGDSVVVTATLYEASTGGRNIWNGRFAERVEGRWDWSLIERVTRDLSAALREELGREIQLRRWRAETESHEAWQLLQRARRGVSVGWGAFMRGEGAYATSLLGRADSLFSEAARLDDGWAEPHLLRAELSERRAVVGRFLPPAGQARSPADFLREGVTHVDRALELDPGNARAWELRGTLGMARLSLATPSGAGEYLRIEEEAVSDLEWAVELDPFLAPAWSKLASIHLSRGEFEEARRAAETARREDAFLERGVETGVTLAEAAFELGDEAGALQLAREGQRRHGGTAFAELELQMLAWGGDVAPDADRAWELVERIRSEPGSSFQAGLAPVLEMTVAGVLVRAGLADSARVVMDRARRAAPDDPRLLRREVAVLARLGETGSAMDLLDRLLADHPAGPERLLRRKMFEPLREGSRVSARLGTGR